MKRLTALVGALAFAAAAAAQTYDVAVIPKGTTHEFWKSIHAGALAAAEELKSEGVTVNVIWKGPLREDDREQQIQVVENFTGRRVSGLVLAPLDARALVAPTEEAVHAGIPVVIIDSGLKSTAPISTISTDNYKGGVLGARRLGEFLDTMAKEFPAIQILSSDQHAGATRDTAYRVSQNLLNRFGRDVTGIFAPNESSATGMLLAMRDAGLVGGKVKLVGFDSGSQTVAALKSGDLQGLVVQNPFRMGYLGVKTLVASLRGRKVELVVDTGCALVTRENMGDPAMADLLHPPLEKYLK
jgi:ribose transport system substrate-binding protein